MNIIMVGLGGAAGAVCRYLASLLPVKSTFPVLTFFTNLVGALFIGFIAGTAAAKGVKPNWLLFWKTGVCGGFTTFSTFSLETLGLLEKHHYITGTAYALLSVALCIAGAALGQYFAKKLFPVP